MTEQNALQNEYDRKTVLMITFCVVLAGYLLAGEWAGWLAAAKIWVSVCLIVSTAKGVSIFGFAKSGVQGLHPRAADTAAFKGKEILLRQYMQREYAQRIDQNQARIDIHAARLESAKRYFYAGLWGTVFVAFGEKMTPVAIALWEKVMALL